ncbi:GIY-YIG nuclease family protein [Pseudomonas sp. 35 E 8]|uniref:GIY-YIG nuclease family protein n=1 Tax=Pseudomonas sp. 35 E 8 TaxID=1844103 RepID=UPI000812AE51|nr:GIY-YIG nuclease family protein [Pseudomonas sp. 35 E 8]CRM19339.1 T5orf172 domain protein [Pseudomonas sp. 35 E 8]
MPVYFIGQVQSNNCTRIKIGRTGNITRRRGQLQTGSPHPLEIMGWIRSDDEVALEKQLHIDFAHRRQIGEWFRIEPGEILPILRAEGDSGFVAKNADAFEITGYDRDAVPEYLGVWAWCDLEFHECCPFCGCFCGMHYQDASSMYHCTNCDALTDFSELSPYDDE